MDDGLRAGLFDLEDLVNVPLTGALVAQVRELHPSLDDSRTTHEIVRRQITLMVEDVIREAMGRLANSAPQSAQAVRELDYAIVSFSPELEQQEKELKAFLFDKMYRHPSVMRNVDAAQSILSDLYRVFWAGDASLPDDPQWSLEGLDDFARATRIADYLAGMTDRFAVSEHRRLFDHTPELG